MWVSTPNGEAVNLEQMRVIFCDRLELGDGFKLRAAEGMMARARGSAELSRHQSLDEQQRALQELLTQLGQPGCVRWDGEAWRVVR